jgi:hypothetical protein
MKMFGAVADDSLVDGMWGACIRQIVCRYKRLRQNSWDRRGMEPAGEDTFFCGKRGGNHESIQYFLCK